MVVRHTGILSKFVRFAQEVVLAVSKYKDLSKFVKLTQKVPN